ncbi:MAG: L-2-hydroxyglutarate oxidase [Bacteroidota bacterium]
MTIPQDNSLYDYIIIGGGIVGLASAYKLQVRHRNLRILVLEKESTLASHQTGHNSGVIHSGLYYKPGSYKARNCVDGRHQLVAFSKAHKIPHDVCGKVVVATHESELPHMERIFNNGVANNTEGIEKINGDQIREIEPFCAGIAGIWVPCTGIIDFPAVVFKLAELIPALNPASQVLTSHKVLQVVHGEAYSEVKTQQASFQGKRLIFCGGLQSDRLAKMDKASTEAKIVGFRGDYYELTDSAAHKVKHLIYPVPNPAFPFLGVHFTRMIRGGIECGPNAVFSFKREGYNKTAFDLADSIDALTYKGTWKLFSRHWKFGLNEYRRAFSKRLFLEQVQRLIPSLTMEEIKAGRAGVRAMALGPDGNMIEDFKIEFKGNSIHILNAPSPAATSCLAIGDEVSQMATQA